jgi:hypothetical protein
VSRVIVVTGLPRSGTSLLMQMLDAAGVPLLVDDARPADEDNPCGFHEYAPVKRLDRDSSWLPMARGKAVKVVAPLLPHLPSDLPCDVLFIQRSMEEVLDSQRAMLARKGLPTPAPDEDERLRGLFERSLEAARRWSASASDARLLDVSHGELLKHPEQAARRIAAFLGLDERHALMAAVVDASLHRQRAQQ